MNLVVFYQQEHYKKQFEHMVHVYSSSINSFDITYAPLVEGEPPEGAYVSVFLVSFQRANTQSLHNKVNKLKQMGAYDQSMMVVLNDREMVSPEDLEVVKKDLYQSLSKVIANPNILHTSFQAFEAYEAYKANGENVNFMFWDEEREDYKTLIQCIKEGDLSPVLRFANLEELHNRFIHQFQQHPYLAARKDSSKVNVFAFGLPAVIQHELQVKDINLYCYEDMDKMHTLRHDMDSFVLCYLPFHQVTEEKLAQYENTILLVDGEAQWQPFEMEKAKEKWARKFPKIDLMLISTYLLKQIGSPAEKNRFNNQIVLEDDLGFPLPKDRVDNWDEALRKTSRIRKLKQTLETKKRKDEEACYKSM